MTLNDLAQRAWAARGGEGIAPDDFAFAVGQAALDALPGVADEAARDPRAKHHLLTDPATTTAELDSEGACDLSDLVADPGVSLDRLSKGRIYHASNRFPLVPQSGPGEGSIASCLDALFLHYWLEGSKLKTRSSDDNATPLSGPLSFAVPFEPTLDRLPDALAPSLVAAVAARLAKWPVERAAPKTVEEVDD